MTPTESTLSKAIKLRQFSVKVEIKGSVIRISLMESGQLFMIKL
jgi:hypothetical protein